MTDLEIHCERRGAAGRVLLDRPKALNALTPAMTRALARALESWARDPAVERVVIRGAGERAFSAGGDIRLLHEQGKAGDHDAQLAFWREEYQHDRRIKTYPKPIVVLAGGITMGGGVGLMMNAAHRVVDERFVFAMPEVGIVIPSHACALGKALIAFDSDASRTVLGRSTTRRSMTGETITDPETLRHQLDEIRTTGVATEVEEAVIGECGLASPLVDAAGLITGAIGIVVPSGEWPVAPSSSDALRSAARAISRELGADRWPPALTT